MNIILIGYRCTGKTKVGKALAKKLNWEFFDADENVEKKAGRKIKEIVENGGWTEFRKLEKNVISELSENDKCVIATGGGAVLDKDNVKNLKKNGILILFNMSPERIIKKLEKKAKEGKRPSLTGKGVADEVLEVLKERTPYYESAADYVIDRTEHEVNDTLKEIERILKELNI